jgi:hypothetical protein
MLFHENFSEGLVAILARHDLDLLFLHLVDVGLFLFRSFFLYGLDRSSEILRGGFPIIGRFFEALSTLHSSILLLLLLLLLGDRCLFFVDHSLGLRVEFFSFAHEHQFACFGVLFQSLSVELSATTLRTLNKIGISRHRLFDILLLDRLFLIQNRRSGRFRFRCLNQWLSLDLLNRSFNLLLFFCLSRNQNSFLSNSHRILLNRDSFFLSNNRIVIENQFKSICLSST